jgi:DNA-binding transcriptional LysR family regulator
VNLTDLESFREVARSRSVSKAAAKHGLAQPTVTARIQNLEAELEVKLFRRIAHGVEITDAGRTFLDYAERSLTLVEEGRLAARREMQIARIRLAAPASFAEALFPGLAATLVKRGYEVLLSTNHSPLVVEMLMDRRIDAGIVLSGTSLPTLLALPLEPIEIVCVATVDHALAAAGRRVLLADIAKHQIAMFEWGEEIEDLRERLAFARAGETPPAFSKISPASVARSLVTDHGAVSFLPEPLVAADIRAGRIKRIEPEDLPPYRWSPQLLLQPDAPRGRAIDALLEVLGASLPSS